VGWKGGGADELVVFRPEAQKGKREEVTKKTEHPEKEPNTETLLQGV